MGKDDSFSRHSSHSLFCTCGFQAGLDVRDIKQWKALSGRELDELAWFFTKPHYGTLTTSIVLGRWRFTEFPGHFYLSAVYIFHMHKLRTEEGFFLKCSKLHMGIWSSCFCTTIPLCLPLLCYHQILETWQNGTVLMAAYVASFASGKVQTLDWRYSLLVVASGNPLCEFISLRTSQQSLSCWFIWG